MTALNVLPGAAYTFEFTNFKGELRSRRVIARALQWGSTAWHPEIQWFLDGFDLDKHEARSFPLSAIRLGSFRAMTDPELDVLLTSIALAAVEAFQKEAELET